MTTAQEATARLADFTKYVESRFPIGRPSVSRFAATGEDHVEFAPHLKKEGEVRFAFPSADEAISVAKKDFDDYAATRGDGVLYWRVKPELEYRSQDGGWLFYMRLLISDKPPQTKES
jgi:hypothetical protein